MAQLDKKHALDHHHLVLMRHRSLPLHHWSRVFPVSAVESSIYNTSCTRLVCNVRAATTTYVSDAIAWDAGVRSGRDLEQRHRLSSRRSEDNQVSNKTRQGFPSIFYNPSSTLDLPTQLIDS
jgi:hypothetical protein